MTDKQALLNAIRLTPGDDAPRLVYADWLDEHDEDELAYMIRVCLKEPHRESRVVELAENCGPNRVGYLCLPDTKEPGSIGQAVADVLRVAPFDLFGTCDLFGITIETLSGVGHKVVLEYRQRLGTG